MTNTNLDRNQAWKLLTKHLKNKNLRKHCLAVEATMRAFARRFGKDQQKWGICGLLHDIDWEETKNEPEKHALKGAEILKKAGYQEDIVRAVKVHNHMLELKPETPMEKTLWAVDELTGLVVATALVHPNKLADVTSESVLKKMDEKAFAKGVNRKVIRKGAKLIDLELEDEIKITLKAMKSIKDKLEL